MANGKSFIGWLVERIADAAEGAAARGKRSFWRADLAVKRLRAKTRGRRRISDAALRERRAKRDQ